MLNIILIYALTTVIILWRVDVSNYKNKLFINNLDYKKDKEWIELDIEYKIAIAIFNERSKELKKGIDK